MSFVIGFVIGFVSGLMVRKKPTVHKHVHLSPQDAAELIESHEQVEKLKKEMNL
jgi:hypothetical protein